MKKLIYSIFLLIAVSGVSLADKEEVSKSYNETYSVNNKSSFFIDNKYGDIIIANWDKNEINIDLKITVKAKSKEKAENVLKQITAQIGQSEDSVFAKTVFAKQFKNNGKVEIDIKYIVKAPASMRYNINNKYGNIAIAKITGPTEINLKYGNLLAKELRFTKTKPLNEIDLAYSNADIHYCNYAEIEIKYGNLKLGKGKAIDLEAQYSDINISKLETIYFEGKYGGFELDTVNLAKIEAKYMNVDIVYLSYKIESEIKYGNLSINNISPFFSKIDIEASFGNVKLLIHPDAVYQLDADIDYGNLDLPKKANIDRIVKKKGEEIEGIVGPKGKAVTGTVKIEMDYGNVTL